MPQHCQVCGVPSARIHFGGVVCSACSAFFRRTVVRGHEYRCKQMENCLIVSTIRNMCKKCRYTKCILVGMKRESVQKFRDVYGKREITVKNSTKTASPILKDFVKNYEHLENVRRVIHRDNSRSVFAKEAPRPVNYKEATKVLLKEFKLVKDWINNSFREFSELPDDQKTTLLHNFYLQFIILEGGYFACQYGRTDITYLPSGDYIDCVNPETYYHDPDGQQPISEVEASKMFASSFDTYRRNVYDPMIRIACDKFEFLALTALTLFDTGLEGQSDQCTESCRRIRESVQREVLQYSKLTRSELDSSIRLGDILSILPNLQRATQRFHEDMTISNVMNAYSVDEIFYNMGFKTS
ncbi:Nuclear Hormone Receptor family [Caenorhabditis elegans]|uniref:Nuclear Hormone Receptor family n=1 Tax=Caenorhabditis elegans TaxID=6239 RepID=Q95Y07_CAEEL|nr:Nuclear Hormone Receptor family [Caenorhabditis elegans]CCD66708.1 Nuclear Hormone Receptor family [Caenorhabditis elegans]|eukprot:NP_500111.3 Nuclear Hormone Receptor family [Caenorhabditis elegans]